jgi:hypothetical protein
MYATKALSRGNALCIQLSCCILLPLTLLLLSLLLLLLYMQLGNAAFYNAYSTAFPRTVSWWNRHD